MVNIFGFLEQIFQLWIDFKRANISIPWGKLILSG